MNQYHLIGDCGVWEASVGLQRECEGNANVNRNVMVTRH